MCWGPDAIHFPWPLPGWHCDWDSSWRPGINANVLSSRLWLYRLWLASSFICTVCICFAVNLFIQSNTWVSIKANVLMRKEANEHHVCCLYCVLQCTRGNLYEAWRQQRSSRRLSVTTWIGAKHTVAVDEGEKEMRYTKGLQTGKQMPARASD